MHILNSGGKAVNSKHLSKVLCICAVLEVSLCINVVHLYALYTYTCSAHTYRFILPTYLLT